MATYAKLSDINTKFDYSSARKYSDIEAFLPDDFKKAFNGLTDQVKVDSGWNATQYGADMGALNSDIKLSEIMNGKDGFTANAEGKLSSGTERQLDRMGRGVNRLSDKAMKEGEKLGKSYGKFVESMRKDMSKYQENIRTTLEKARTQAIAYSKGAQGSNNGNNVEEIIGQIAGDDIKITSLANGGGFKIDIGNTGVGTFATIDEATNKLADKYNSIAEELTKGRMEAISRVDEAVRERLGTLQEGIAEFRKENLGKLEELLGRPAGVKSSVINTAEVSAEKGAPQLEQAAATKGKFMFGAVVGGIAGGLAGQAFGSEENKTTSMVVGVGIGALGGGIAQKLITASSTAIGAAHTGIAAAAHNLEPALGQVARHL